VLDGRKYVVPDDARDFALPVLSHRVILRPEALTLSLQRGGIGHTAESIRTVLDEVLARVDIPR